MLQIQSHECIWRPSKAQEKQDFSIENPKILNTFGKMKMRKRIFEFFKLYCARLMDYVLEQLFVI